MHRIITKLDKIDGKLQEIVVIQAVQTEQLKQHMHRSDLLEARIEQVDKQAKSQLKRWLGTLVAIATIAIAFKELIK